MKKAFNSKTESVASGRSRGRPREFDREAALEQAMLLFWAKGYEGTSIADLTNAMGIGGPSLYAAFGSKEALYVDAIRHYCKTQEPLFWGGFQAAPTARDAVRWLLLDTAVTLSRSRGDAPNGCMVALSSFGESHEGLGDLLRVTRSGGLERIMSRLEQAVAEGEIPPTTDCSALARFVQTVQGGMSILARDGASRSDLEKVAHVAMDSWDAQVSPKNGTPQASR